MAMVLEVPQELEERVRFWSKETRETPDELMALAIEKHLKDLENHRICLEAPVTIRRRELTEHEIDCVMSKLIAEAQDWPVPDWVHTL